MLSITVNTLVDEMDNSITDGDVSLRDAINLATANETIQFNVGGLLLLDQSLGELSINKPLRIEGPGAAALVISGGGHSRIFRIDDADADLRAEVEISELTLTEGAAPFGGAIRSSENLTLRNCVVFNNHASDDGGGLFLDGVDAEIVIEGTTIAENTAADTGGGINLSRLGGHFTLSDSLVQNNVATRTGGGVRVVDGFLTPDEVRIQRSTIQANTASYGGGLYLSNRSPVTLFASSIVDNVATGVSGPSGEGGGGIHLNSALGGSTTIEATTISGNVTRMGNPGGGIEFEGQGRLNLRNVTVSDNYANGSGGGIYATANITISHSTIASNSGMDAGGIDVPSSGTLQLDHTIVADNVSTNAISTPDVRGVAPVLTNHSLLETSTALIGANNIIGTDPRLLPLDNNGGPTQTHALAPDSPAIDAGADFPSSPPATDQRLGFGRIVGSRIDIGAFEFSPAPIVILVNSGGSVVDFVGPTSLAEAIQYVGAPEGVMIEFDRDATGPFIVLDFPLRIGGPVQIRGPGSDQLEIGRSQNRQDGVGGGFRLFRIDDGDLNSHVNVVIEGVTLSGGVAPDIANDANGGAILSFENLTLRDVEVKDSTTTRDGADGGGVHLVLPSGATALIEDAYIHHNQTEGTLAANGGGLSARVHPNAQLTIQHTTIANNSTLGTLTGGAGVALANEGQVNILRSQIRDNQVANNSGGGGLNLVSYNGGTVQLDTVSISNNSASRNAGGIWGTLVGGTLDIFNSTISGNAAATAGGGIDLYASSGDILRLVNSTVSGNIAHGNGGGLSLAGAASAQLQHSTITLNQSDGDLNGDGTGAGIYSNLNSLQLDHTILSDNVDPTGVAPDGSGNLIARYSLIGIGDGLSITDQGGNQVGSLAAPRDALLGPLANNGGSTLTHALISGSPAIDAGDPALMAGAGGTPLSDQRGSPFTRVYDGAFTETAIIDIGAYERQSVPVPTCDFDASGACDLDDLDALIAQIAMAAHQLNFDLTGDGLVNLEDRDRWLADAGALNLPSGAAYRLADANLDGNVDGQDFVIWNANKFTSVPAWSAGDFNADGNVDGQDFVIWNANKFTTADRSSGHQDERSPLRDTPFKLLRGLLQEEDCVLFSTRNTPWL